MSEPAEELTIHGRRKILGMFVTAEEARTFARAHTPCLLVRREGDFPFAVYALESADDDA